MKYNSTLVGSSAILMWSLLALVTSKIINIPQFQLLALTFTVGGVIGILFVARKGKVGFLKLKQPPLAWIISVGGLFGYHFFYFTALANAPVADASLIAYLWPLLIVFFSAFLPGERLLWNHILGALIGLSGATLLVAGKDNFSFSSEYTFGYLAAVGCAITWSLYSVLNRTQKDIPTEAVAGFCLMTALLGAISHVLTEQWVSPSSEQWIAIVALGIGPVGAAFYAWDYGTKHGNIRLLGVLSYGTPLLSTIILTLSGTSEATMTLAIACILITAGALIASLEHFKKTS